MSNLHVTRETLESFLRSLDESFAGDASVYLIGETTQVLEGWRPWTREIELAPVVESGRENFDVALARAGEEFRVRVCNESPADVIPLPDGYRERSHAVSLDGVENLSLYHFDPYSVVLRFVARGDEPDYHMALVFIEHGWVRVSRLDEMLDEVLAGCTSETIQQDPAELRRKYRGLMQMWRAVTPGTVHPGSNG